MIVVGDCTCGQAGVCLVCALAAFDEVYPPVEPTDEQTTRPTVHVPDTRDEHAWDL